jgi:hypothetical protein
MRRSTSRMEGVRLAGKAAEESDMITTNKKHRLALCVATPKSAGNADNCSESIPSQTHSGASPCQAAARRQPDPGSRTCGRSVRAGSSIGRPASRHRGLAARGSRSPGRDQKGQRAHAGPVCPADDPPPITTGTQTRPRTAARALPEKTHKGVLCRSEASCTQCTRRFSQFTSHPWWSQ